MTGAGGGRCGWGKGGGMVEAGKGGGRVEDKERGLGRERLSLLRRHLDGAGCPVSMLTP